jgi:hypothetical protein
MSTKSSLKLVVALGLLAMLLIYLGVNYVPRIFAASSIKENLAVTSIQTRSDYVDERYPRAMVPQLFYGGSDWFERHSSAAIQFVNYTGSDWIDRHPSNYYANSDWIERHP